MTHLLGLKTTLQALSLPETLALILTYVAKCITVAEARDCPVPSSRSAHRRYLFTMRLSACRRFCPAWNSAFGWPRTGHSAIDGLPLCKRRPSKVGYSCYSRRSGCHYPGWYHIRSKLPSNGFLLWSDVYLEKTREIVFRISLSQANMRLLTNHYIVSCENSATKHFI